MKRFLTCLSLALLSHMAISQGNHSVDMVTGTLNVNIPIFNITDGDIQVPGVLNYAANGVKITDDDGWMGHNWNLSVQSFKISREMRGLPDDFQGTGSDTRKGWLFGTAATQIKNFSPSTETANYTFLNGFGYTLDTEPDVFFVNAPGLSFQFYFDENHLPQVVGYQDVKITTNPSPITGPITSITVKDPKGVLYTFSDVESTTQSILSPSTYYLVRKSKLQSAQFTYTTSWWLTSIKSPMYGTVNFTYRVVNTNDSNLFTESFKKTNQYKYRFPITISNSYTSANTISYGRSSTLKILQKVSSPSTEAVFTSAPKYPGVVLERLSGINIYDKREGTSKLIKQILFSYTISGAAQRAFLTNLKEKTTSNELNHNFEYNLSNSLPPYNSKDIDGWSFYKILNPNSLSLQYDESAVAGTLRKIIYPLKGYSVFFYETHDYWDGTTNVQGGGIRIKKFITYDGVSSSDDNVKEFTYKLPNGSSSGRLQHKPLSKFSVARQQSPYGNNYTRYLELQQHYPTYTTDQINSIFTATVDQDLSNSNLLNGSAVAYQQVTVKTKDAGQSVYEYDLPSSYDDTNANNNEWVASQVQVARPSSSYEMPNITGGYHYYPFPPNPNYDFARGLLKKVTDYRTDGVIVRDVVNNYQRIYDNGTSIQKIYGLSLEELPTYYYTGSAFVDDKMFLYSKYEVNTNVKTELLNTTETVYHTPDKTRKTQTITSYFFDSPNHRYLSRVERMNSDLSKSITRYKYVNDFVTTSPADAQTTALANLKSAHRFSLPVETTSSKLIAGVEKYLGSNLTTYQTISGLVYPYQLYSFVSTDGTTFTPASGNGSTFTYDQSNYLLSQTFLSFDSYGNSTETMGRDNDVNAVVYGYGGTLPVLTIAHAKSGELKYSDFEPNGSTASFLPGSPFTNCVGRNMSTGINLPGGSSNLLNGTVNNNKSMWFIFSFWIKASTSGTMYLQVGTSSSITLSIPFTASTDWKYYSYKNPIGSMVGNPSAFWVKAWSDVSVQLDDIAFYPQHADFISTTYKIPYGKSSETDSRALSYSYEYDDLGRLTTVYDYSRNVIKKTDYKVRP